MNLSHKNFPKFGPYIVVFLMFFTLGLVFNISTVSKCSGSIGIRECRSINALNGNLGWPFKFIPAYEATSGESGSSRPPEWYSYKIIIQGKADIFALMGNSIVFVVIGLGICAIPWRIFVFQKKYPNNFMNKRLF